MPVKLCRDHAEGFESGLRAWELDVGEWERASGTVHADAVKYTVMMDTSPIFLRNNFQLGTYANSVVFRTVFCYNGVVIPETLEDHRPCQLEMGQVRMMTTGRKSTLSRKVTGKAKANTQTRKELTEANRNNTDINTCKNCG